MKVYRSEKAKRVIRETYAQLLTDWNVPVTCLDVPTRYGKTRVVVCGSEAAPPLVLFHGVGDDLALMWLYNARALSEKFLVYAVDTLGGPGMSEPDARYDANFQDELWLDDVMDGLSLERADIAGVSHGGYLAQLYACARPARVRKIACLAAGVPVGKGSPMKTMMKIFLPEALIPTRRGAIRLLKKLSGENSAAFTENPHVLAHFVALMRGYNNMAMGYHKVRAFDEAQIDSLRGRALYLIGEEDPFAKLGGKQSLLDHHMNARFYPRVGHGINQEIAEEINRQLIEWFACE